jgi:large subunit ribosomal protein L20
MRVRTGVAKNRRLKRILKQVKGYRGARRRRIKLAKEAIVRAGVQAYVGRRLKKRDYKSLWVARLNAAARERGLNYSRLMCGLRRAGV